MSDEVTFPVKETINFVKWLNTRLERLYPTLAYDYHGGLILPEFDPRIDHDDPYEKYRVPNRAECINRDVFIQVDRIDTDRAHVTIRCKRAEVKDWYNSVIEDLEKLGLIESMEATYQYRPPPPPEDANPDSWIDWYYRCKELKFHITLEEVSIEWGIGLRTVKGHKAEYDAEYGKGSMKNVH